LLYIRKFVNNHGRQERCRWGDLRERDHLKDVDVDGRIILQRIFKKGDEGGMDWIDLAQDRGRWRALVIAVMNLPVP
jgi:hypothetical protein